MVATSVFITDFKGKTLIHRDYRGTIPKSIEKDFQRILAENEEADLKPVYYDNGVTFLFVQHNDLYLMSVSKVNANAVLVLNFLNEVIRVFEEYFGSLEQESIRDNFVLIYELLDEMCDFGYPQFTDGKMLKDVICISEQHKLELTDINAAKNISTNITGKVSWRTEGIKHKKNEAFLDVIEKLNLLVSANGTVLHSEILGSLKMKSYLSGMPELKLGLNDKIMMERRRRRKRTTKMVEMDDIRFHQCVRLSRFETDRVISFIPPDGEFELMSYRLDTQVKPLLWVEMDRISKGRHRLDFTVRLKSEFKKRSTANNIEVLIPVPADADTPKFKNSLGGIKWLPDLSAMRWSIKQLAGQKEYVMKASFGLPSITSDDAGQTDSNDPSKRAPIRISFEIPYFTVSGIQVRYLKIVEKSGYQALPWVRYITQNGDYQIRTNKDI